MSPEGHGPESRTEQRTGVFTALAELPEASLVTEKGMSKLLGKSRIRQYDT